MDWLAKKCPHFVQCKQSIIGLHSNTVRLQALCNAEGDNRADFGVVWFSIQSAKLWSNNFMYTLCQPQSITCITDRSFLSAIIFGNIAKYYLLCYTNTHLSAIDRVMLLQQVAVKSFLAYGLTL